MLNKITLHGRLGKDPELKEYEGQNGPFSKATFSLAVSRDRGDDTDWFYCTVLGNRAPVIQKYFHKGSEILIEGRMESFKTNGDEPKTYWNVVVSNFDFCGSKKSNDAPEGFTEVEDDEAFDLF